MGYSIRLVEANMWCRHVKICKCFILFVSQIIDIMSKPPNLQFKIVIGIIDLSFENAKPFKKLLPTFKPEYDPGPIDKAK